MQRRLDTSFYQPRFTEAIARLRSSKWPVKQLHELLEFVTNGADFRNYVEDGTPFIRVADIKPDGIDYSNIMRVPQTVSDVSERQRIRAGDVLFTRKASFGVAAVATKEDESSIISSEIIRLVLAKGLNPHYLAIFNNSKIGQAQCQRHAVGAVMPGINHPTLLRFEIPVPPCPIQDAITDKMDTAYRRKRELETEAKALLESIDGYVLGELVIELPLIEETRRFVQMAHAVRGGRLTPYYYQPKFALVTEILDERGDIAHLGDLAESISNGIEIRQYVEQGTPYLRVSDMKADGVDLSNVRYVAKGPNQIPNRIRLKEGDLLISRSGTLGMVAVVTEEIADCIISSHIRRIALKPKLKDMVTPRYLVEFLRTEAGERQFFQRDNGTVVPEIDREALSTIRIPVPSRSLQEEIAAEVQRRRNRAAALREEAARVVAEAKAEVERMILGEGEGQGEHR